jgi:citrate lyase beta subunit
LMTPAHQVDLLKKQAASAADVACLDLEDSVPNRKKLLARECAADALRRLTWGDKERVVRVNNMGDEFGPGDVEAMAAAGAEVVLLTKVRDSADVDCAAAIIDNVGTPTTIWCMIETAASLLHLDSIAMAPHVSGLFLGAGDLSLDLRVRAFGATSRGRAGPPAASDILLYARSRVVTAARALGLTAIDSAMGRLDAEDVRASAARAFEMGFDGKLIVTPAHIAIVHDAYLPTADEVTWARRVIEALEEAERIGLGSAVVDGEPMDGPYLGYALDVLARAEHSDLAFCGDGRQ